MASTATRAIDCPICRSAVSVGATAGALVEATCGLCGTALVVLEDGSVLTVAEWKHRCAKEGNEGRTPAGSATTPDAAGAPEKRGPVQGATRAGKQPRLPAAPRPSPKPMRPSTSAPAARTTSNAAATGATAAEVSSVPRLATAAAAANAAVSAAVATPAAPASSAQAPKAPAADSAAAPTATPTSVPVDAAGASVDGRAFQGSLQNLSVVDVLQLLYSSRKSGLLRLTGPGGTATIALKDGHIVGGNNPTRKRHIGQILIEQGAVTQAEVDAALAAQQRATGCRQPLVATLVSRGALTAEVGWRALEKLMEELVIDVLNWDGGEFAFEVGVVNPADGFRHLADGVLEGRGLDTQNTLLEALRAMDEHNRGGVRDESPIDLEAAFAPTPGTPPETALPEARPAAPTGLPARARALWHRVLTRARPGLTRLRERLVALPRRTRLAAAAIAGVLFLTLVLLAVLTSDETGVEPATTPPAALAVEPAPVPVPIPLLPEPTPTVPAEPTAAGDVAAVGDEPVAEPAKKVVGKRKGKKQKAKDARSLFDAALTP